MTKRDRSFDAPRRRGFDDDNYGARSSSPRGASSFDRPPNGTGAQPRSSGFGFTPAAAADGPIVTATVNWFNSEKGFGFVSLMDGGGDAFLHASCLEQIGIRMVNPGATLKCRIGQGAKGPQVTEVSEVDESTAAAPAPRGAGGFTPRAGGAPPRGRPQLDASSATEAMGTVKWYNPEKGFGFVDVGDGGKDVFVHASVLQRAGIGSLDPAQQVRLKFAAGMKGREAVEISLD